MPVAGLNTRLPSKYVKATAIKIKKAPCQKAADSGWAPNSSTIKMNGTSVKLVPIGHMGAFPSMRYFPFSIKLSAPLK